MVEQTDRSSLLRTHTQDWEHTLEGISTRRRLLCMCHAAGEGNFCSPLSSPRVIAFCGGEDGQCISSKKEGRWMSVVGGVRGVVMMVGRAKKGARRKGTQVSAHSWWPLQRRFRSSTLSVYLIEPADVPEGSHSPQSLRSCRVPPGSLVSPREHGR